MLKKLDDFLDRSNLKMFGMLVLKHIFFVASKLIFASHLKILCQLQNAWFNNIDKIMMSKNPTYGRHKIYQQMRIVAHLQVSVSNEQILD